MEWMKNQSVQTILMEEKKNGQEGKGRKNQKDMKESVSDSLHLPQYLTF